MKKSLSIAVAGTILWMASTAGAQTELPEIRDYVHRIHFEGIPYAEASGYTSSSVPTLLEMLGDPQEEQYWTNIVGMLGIIGDEQALDPLINFIEKHVEETLSPAHYRAKTSALMSLGYMVNKSQSERALAYLTEKASPTAWEEMEGASPFTTEAPARNQDFAKYAVLGLAMSGHPTAGKVLEELQSAGARAEASSFQAQIGDMVSEALNANRTIAEKGLAGYYEEEKEKR